MRPTSFVILSSVLLGTYASQLLPNDESNHSAHSLLWGPYRPNLYFGVKPRIPNSLLTGLMWGRVEDFETVQKNFRHTCEQHAGMSGYGWEEYDVRQGGKQVIRDAGNKIDITTDFVKFPGGHNGGSWAVRVKGQPRDDASPNLRTSVVFYAGMEGDDLIAVENTPNQFGFSKDVNLKGNGRGLGEFSMKVTRGPDTNRYPGFLHETYAAKPLNRTIVSSLTIPGENIWQAKNILFMQLKAEIDKYVEQYGDEQSPPPHQVFTIANSVAPGNFHLIQKVFEGAFEFDIIFQSRSSLQNIGYDEVNTAIGETSRSFSDRFSRVLKPQPPFEDPKWLEFSKAMFSNLIGGIGYFYGDQIVDKSYAEEYEEVNEDFWEEVASAKARGQISRDGPFELFTSIPSRPFFPRGFLWDEGFHLIPVADWDMDLTLDIVQSWYRLIDEDGWIAREQILGHEARSKVPPEFTVQYPHFANPPTLFLILEAFTEKLTLGLGAETWARDPFDGVRNSHLRSKESARKYLTDVYPLVKRQYQWLRKTQQGDIKSYEREAFSNKEAYRWRGRTPDHILTSGLDDYPRPQPPHPGELHVDLMSWMGLAARSLKNIAAYIGEKEDQKEFAAHETAILRNLDDLHWSEQHQTYCDATIDDYEENIHVCHKGYISIFPFMTGLMGPKHPHLGAVLDLIADPEEIWSEYGILSLSRKDRFYMTGENYWRSPIWININYLILKNLLDVAKQAGPHRKKAGELYSKLRFNLANNVFNEWKRTGFAWEQYNPEDGRGQRTQHFTGWTSLIVKIMTMEDLESSKYIPKEEL